MRIETPFELTTARGWPLRGDVRHPSEEGTGSVVVVCHGFKGFKDWGFFPELGRRLADAGHTAISFNFSGNGIGAAPQDFSEPERFRANTLSLEIEDLGLLLDTARSGALPGLRGPAPAEFALLGHSRGGLIAVITASRRKDIRRLITWNGVGELSERFPAALRAEWRSRGKLDVVNTRTGQVLEMGLETLDDLEAHLEAYDPRTVAPGLGVPWLIVHGTRDLTVPIAEGETLARLAAPGGARFHPIEGGDHTLGVIHPYQKSTPQLDEAVAATLAWLGEPPMAPVGPPAGTQ